MTFLSNIKPQLASVVGLTVFIIVELSKQLQSRLFLLMFLAGIRLTSTDSRGGLTPGALDRELCFSEEGNDKD